MKIQMAGIDYRRASIEEREAFALTKSGRSVLAAQMVRDFGLNGCVILSTCNRTEFWVSGDAAPLETILEQSIGLAADHYRQLFTQRSGRGAADYLFRLACGIESQIFGEDQILGQVKEAAELAREAGSMDAVLETLFRSAVTGAKAVKTQVRLTPANHSIAEAAVELLGKRYPTLTGQNCLVIGSGEMGCLTAQALLAQGARVSITVRGNGCPHSVRRKVPQGCTVVDYEERVALMEKFPIVVSATASPHFTLRCEAVCRVLKSPHTFLDLAVPRDIDSRIGQLPFASLFDLDHLGLQHTAGQEAMQQAEQILREHQERFAQWYAFRELAPDIQAISRRIAEDAGLRMRKKVTKELQAELFQAVEKAAAKCFYGWKQSLPEALWEPCIRALAEPEQQEDIPGKE